MNELPCNRTACRGRRVGISLVAFKHPGAGGARVLNASESKTETGIQAAP